MLRVTILKMTNYQIILLYTHYALKLIADKEPYNWRLWKLELLTNLSYQILNRHQLNAQKMSIFLQPVTL